MKKILLADDFDVDMMLIRIAVESFHSQYTVKLAYDGEEAYRLLKTMHFDLVLLDIKMPLLDGFELMERLHTDGAGLIPTIIVSGFGIAEHRARALALGADDFIHKAVDYNVFKADLRSALGRHGLL
jgi:CheY-like chemotaxis protein